MGRFRKLAVLTGLLFGLSSNAQAAPVTLYGTDVSFSFDDALLGLFGGTLAPIVVGNSLFFQPDDFTAESLNGAGADQVSENLSIAVVATTPGYNITSLAMAEQGDYILNGTGASVTASMRLQVTSATTGCGSPIPFPCTDNSLVNLGPFADTGGSTVNWSGSASVDLADTAGWGSDTSLQISFQNNLSATTLSSGEIARIQKKAAAVGLIVNPIPVPAALWLFGSGLVGLAAVARRRREFRRH